MRGTSYSGIDDPAIPSDVRRKWERRRVPIDRREEWVKAENERWRVVDTCVVCGRGMIAEEVRAHRIGHLSSKVRVLARMAEELSEAQRMELVEWLD